MDATHLLNGTTARWLVTGAAGFIGSHLAESLALAGQEVTAVDNFVTGKRANIDSVQRAIAEARGSLTFIEGDIRDSDLCRTITANVDFVLHQAAIGSVPRSIADPLASFGSNVDGFMQILTASRDARVKALVYASSSSVYGDDPTLPKLENRAGRVLSPYAATKAADELFAGVFARCYGMRVAGLRYFNVFGARQDPDGAYAAVIPRWIDAMLHGRPVIINGDGQTSRDFCFIDNVVQANIKAALLVPQEPDGIVLNVAAGQQTTLLSLFGLLKDLLASEVPHLPEVRADFADFRPGDIRHSLASIDRAREVIGYVPTHTLAEGLGLALEWYLSKAATVA